MEHFAWCAGALELGIGIDKYMHVLTTATIRRDSVALLLVQHIVFTKFIVFIRYHSGVVGEEYFCRL